MEPDDLKTQWEALDARLSRIETKMNTMTTGVVSGAFTSSMAWLQRRFRMDFVLVCLLLILWPTVIRSTEEHWSNPNETVLISFYGLLCAVVVVRAFILRHLLRRIDPARMSVRELSVAVLRFRRWYFIGMTAGIVVGVATIVLLGVCWRLTTDFYLLCGFIVGLAIGLALGVPRCRRTLREINALRAAVRD